MDGKHPRFPNYRVTDAGKVYRIEANERRKAGEEIVGRILTSGYRQFKLTDHRGARVHVRANRLVAEIFHGPAPTARHHAAHRDGNRLNNCASNLYWATPQQNQNDKIAHGTLLKGERVGTARLTEAAVRDIKTQFTGKRGEIAMLSRKHSVGASTIKRVLTGEYWRHVIA